MSRIRDLGRRVAARVARRVGQAELFERPGERVPQAPIPTMPAAGTKAPAEGNASMKASEAARPGTASPDEPAGAAACTIADLDMLKAAVGPGGGIRVVNHWATWCIPCVEEFDVLKSLSSQLGEVPLLGISWDMFDPRGDEDDIREHVENFGSGHSLDWPTLLVGEAVPAERFFEAFSITFQQIPQTWVVDDAGDVVHRIDGVLDADGVAAIIAAVGRC